MTPEQKIKAHILQAAILAGDVDAIKSPITAENIDERFAAANDDYQLQDYMSEFREGDFETDIAAPYSRHYEAKSVARKMGDGSWIGWTYWYGGGKYGEPGAIDWMEEAYELECTEEEKMITVRTFTQKAEQPA
jgi:hypothetical protein